jgi:hypothetical protein
VKARLEARVDLASRRYCTERVDQPAICSQPAAAAEANDALKPRRYHHHARDEQLSRKSCIHAFVRDVNSAPYRQDDGDSDELKLRQLEPASPLFQQHLGSSQLRERLRKSSRINLAAELARICDDSTKTSTAFSAARVATTCCAVSNLKRKFLKSRKRISRFDISLLSFAVADKLYCGNPVVNYLTARPRFDVMEPH